MKFSRLDDWLGWQESLHPSSIELGLDRVRTVYGRMDARPAPIIVTVGGTNGKGSCVACLDAILRQAGFRVGRYTSPHLVRYNERICVDGQEVADEALMAAFQRVEDARRDTSLTYFEYGTLAAFEVFSRASLDVAILEVGLGGRLDAVNIIDADVALVTTVDLDHAAWLGDDRESIGREKAGIFRAGRAAVYGADDPPQSLLDTAAKLGTPLWIAGRDYRYRAGTDGWEWRSAGVARAGLPLPRLRGAHQVQNAAAVLAVLQRLADRLPVDQRAVRAGLLSVQSAGRFEVLAGSPTVVLDVAHNAQAARALADNLRRFPRRGRLLGVFGALRDKDVAGILAPLAGQVDRWYLGGLEGERGLDVAGIMDRSAGLLESAVACDTIVDAFGAATGDAKPEDVVLAFGSFFVVAAVLGELRKETTDDAGAS